MKKLLCVLMLSLPLFGQGASGGNAKNSGNTTGGLGSFRVRCGWERTPVAVEKVPLREARSTWEYRPFPPLPQLSGGFPNGRYRLTEKADQSLDVLGHRG